MMHTIPELGTSVPAFLAKLWKLVEDPETDDLICWSPNGRSFFIRNQAQFARELLPHYYKHNNMASFVRQLNMYGFHKKVSVELGGLKCDRDEMEFAHQFFCKGHPYLVEHIKRKIATSKGQNAAHTPIKPELMNKMLTEVRSMRGRQEQLDSRLGAMKRENEALWRELAMLRQKHLKQQQIVNKLIHFLVTLVQPSRSGGLPVKRRYPLMIDDSSRQRNKQSKLSKTQASPTGPVIHELDASEHDLDSQYIVAEMLESHQNPAIESPEHTAASVIDDENMETIQLVDDSMQSERDIQLINAHQSELRKRGCKSKKKEETHLLEVPIEESSTLVESLEKKSVASKPIPVATVRSSKLKAMAANIRKAHCIEQQLNFDSPGELEDDVHEANPGIVKLEDILIVPEIINEENPENDETIVDTREEIADGDCVGQDNTSFHQPSNEISEVLADADSAEEYHENTENPATQSAHVPQLLPADQQKNRCNGASTSASKDLSLSRMNSSGINDATYRLGSTEEMDNHLETMQTELENLREILRGEGYSIDANTLLGLFGADDPMSFAMPVNPELDPHSHCERDDDSHINVAESNGTGRGELMAYNPAPNLLDFDDDIFFGATSSSPINHTTDTTSVNLCTPDPLDLEDSKASLLESLGANDVNSTS